MKFIFLIIPFVVASCASCNSQNGATPDACATQNQQKASEHPYHWIERGDF